MIDGNEALVIFDDLESKGFSIGYPERGGVFRVVLAGGHACLIDIERSSNLHWTVVAVLENEGDLEELPACVYATDMNGDFLGFDKINEVQFEETALAGLMEFDDFDAVYTLV